ncbi:MAG: aminodeoxychorismate/anthranilate synthase component II [Legionellales bacterium]|nr:aminodeoxychorismate/anthranilate synthase component II [Legionellales bacterium]
MILLIDNYDSFTNNIASYLSILKYEVSIVKNDEISINKIKKLSPQKIILSPGPGKPNDAGITLEVIDKFHKTTPILGICLGHQAIGQYFGANIIHSQNLIHGHPVTISHNNSILFNRIPSPFNAVRYNSLTIELESLPKCLELTAWSNNKKINTSDLMSINHRSYQSFGVQFHPDSYGSEFGIELIQNFCVI